MNIYIPYSINRDIFKGEELRFAIRSIEKYLTGWEEIILIGTAPDWFNGKVIEAGDIEGRKEESIYKKMLLINDHEFLRWDDDHFLLRPLHVSQIKSWYDGKLSNYKNGSTRYQEAVNRTAELRADVLNYDVHAPMIFNGTEFRIIFKNVSGDVCVKSYYQLFTLSQNHAEPMADLKINQWLPKEEIKKLIDGRLFFSTGTLFDPIRELLNELYPNKSSYESK